MTRNKRRDWTRRCGVCDATYRAGEYRDHVRALYHSRALMARRGQKPTRLYVEGEEEDDLPSQSDWHPVLGPGAS